MNQNIVPDLQLWLLLIKLVNPRKAIQGLGTMYVDSNVGAVSGAGGCKIDNVCCIPCFVYCCFTAQISEWHCTALGEVPLYYLQKRTSSESAEGIIPFCHVSGIIANTG